jgi:hypothetical protein
LNAEFDSIWTSSITYTLKRPACRRINRVLEQLPHLIDTGIGRRIDLKQVNKAAAIDFLASRTNTAGRCRDSGLAIQRFGEDARQGRLADPPRTGKQIGVVQALLGERVRQRTDHMLLPNQRRKIARPPLARKNLITHAPHTNAENESGEPNPRHLQ